VCVFLCVVTSFGMLWHVCVCLFVCCDMLVCVLLCHLIGLIACPLLLVAVCCNVLQCVAVTFLV